MSVGFALEKATNPKGRREELKRQQMLVFWTSDAVAI